MSPKATYAAALDEMSPRAGSSAQLERSSVKFSPMAATGNGEQLVWAHHELCLTSQSKHRQG